MKTSGKPRGATAALLKDAKRMLAINAELKSRYGELDSIEDRLIQAARQTGGSLELPGIRCDLRDNFVGSDGETRNKAFKTICAKRFEIAITPIA
jgi:hypothetical protein